jgi:hypothetical protein
LIGKKTIKLKNVYAYPLNSIFVFFISVLELLRTWPASSLFIGIVVSKTHGTRRSLDIQSHATVVAAPLDIGVKVIFSYLTQFSVKVGSLSKTGVHAIAYGDT